MDAAFSKLIEIDDYYIDPKTYIAEWEGRPRCLAAALVYASVGWYVFPAPLGKKKSHKKAARSNGANWGMTKDADEIERDFTKWSDANVGIPTGAVNGFFVVEADTVQGHNVDGLASLQALEARYGPLPPTLMAVSPSGSVHRYFRHPGDGIKIKSTDNALAPGVDVKGDGGMVIAPPSVRNDGAYRWLNDLPIANAPPWLLDLVIERPVVREPVEDTNITADETELAAAIEVIPNPDLGWDAWNRIGMALWRGTGGSEGGRAMWHAFSQKSVKYNSRTTDEKWQEYFTSPPDQIGAGTIFWEADQASPGWRSQFDLRIEAALRDAGLREILEAGAVTAEPSDAEPQVAVLHGLDKVTADDTSSQNPPKADGDSGGGDIFDEIANVNRDYALVLAGNNAVVMKFEDGTKFRLLQVNAFNTRGLLGEPVDLAELSLVASTLTRLASRIGIERTPRDVTTLSGEIQKDIDQINRERGLDEVIDADAV